MNALFTPRYPSAFDYQPIRSIVGVSTGVRVIEAEADISITLRPDDGDPRAAFIHMDRAAALSLARLIIQAARPTAGELLSL